MIKLINVLFILLIGSSTMSAQTKKAYFVDLTSIDQNQAFDDVINLLITSDYFIQSTDNDAGIIHCKETVTKKGIFSVNKGKTLEYTLLLRPHEKGIRINLQANLTEKRLTGGMNNTDYHNYDLGVTWEQIHYDGIMNFLRENLGAGVSEPQ